MKLNPVILLWPEWSC